MNTKTQIQQPNKKGPKIIKILILGNSSVGKSSIVVRYTENKFYTTYLATIGVDFVKKVLNINDQEIILQIWDSAGQEKYNAITKQYYNRTDGILVVFDLSSRTTFNGVMNWLEEIELSNASGMPIVILGNKCDLEEKEVSKEEAIEFAQSKGFPYYETSALEGINVNEAFMDVVLKIIENKNKNAKNDKPTFGISVGQTKKEKCCK
jgi:small GTP-binding protein